MYGTLLLALPYMLTSPLHKTEFLSKYYIEYSFNEKAQNIPANLWTPLTCLQINTLEVHSQLVVDCGESHVKVNK